VGICDPGLQLELAGHALHLRVPGPERQKHIEGPKVSKRSQRQEVEDEIPF
jgi:hypothetical protein